MGGGRSILTQYEIDQLIDCPAFVSRLESSLGCYAPWHRGFIVDPVEESCVRCVSDGLGGVGQDKVRRDDQVKVRLPHHVRTESRNLAFELGNIEATLAEGIGTAEPISLLFKNGFFQEVR